MTTPESESVPRPWGRLTDHIGLGVPRARPPWRSTPTRRSTTSPWPLPPTGTPRSVEDLDYIADPYTDVPLPDEPEFDGVEPDVEPDFTYDGPLDSQPGVGDPVTEYVPPVFQLRYDQPDQGDTAVADAPDNDVEPQRGDFGTAYRLDEQAEADSSYPTPVEVDEHQEELFTVDAEVPDRVAAGTVRDDATLRDQELRATLADRTIQGRELRAGLLDDRQVLDDEERRRRYWERVDLGHDRSVDAARDRDQPAPDRQPEPEPQPKVH